MHFGVCGPKNINLYIFLAILTPPMLSKLAFSPSFYWVMQVQLTTNWSMYRKYKIQVDMLDFFYFFFLLLFFGC